MSNFRIVPAKDTDKIRPGSVRRAPILYNYIVDFVSSRGHYPTRRDMIKDLNITSFSDLYGQLRLLRREGLIDFTATRTDLHLVKEDPWRRIERLQRYVRALEYRISVERHQQERDRADMEVIRAKSELQDRDL